MLKYIVLGGAGDVGSRAVEELVVTPGIELVTIADRNLPVAQQIAKRLEGKGAKVAVKQVDAFNHAQLVEAIRGHDIAASALGPFHIFETRCVEAAIEAGVNYCSVCDDWSATHAVLNDLNEKAKKKGVQILTGLGATPGASNACVSFLAKTYFDEIKKVNIYCYQPLDAGGGEAVLRHMLFIVTGELLIYRDGKPTFVRACSEKTCVEMPLIGQCYMWNMGHAEPVTIHRTFPTVTDVTYSMGFGLGSEAFTFPGWLGVFKYPRVKDLVVRAFGFAMHHLVSADKKPSNGSLRIDVTGLKDGALVTRSAFAEAGMRESTGLSLATGAIILGKKEGLVTREPGTYAVEGLLDPIVFLKALKEKGLNAFEDVKMTREYKI